MKKFYQEAAKILINHQVQFSYKVGEIGPIKSAYLTCRLFDITPDAKDGKTIWVETSGGSWASFKDFQDLKKFKNYITELCENNNK